MHRTSREKEKFSPQRSSQRYGINSLSLRGSLLWNALSDDLKLTTSLVKFKIEIRCWDGNNCTCYICTGWCNLHNAGCIMQVTGHVLWPRAAWLYYGAIFLVTLSFLVSGGLVSKLTLGRQKLLFCDTMVFGYQNLTQRQLIICN